MAAQESPHILRALEERLLSRAQDDAQPPLAALLAEGFCEIDRAGRLYGKTEALARRAHARREAPVIADFQIRFLTSEVALLLYRLSETPPETTEACWCSSLWHSRHGRWQATFHQATRVPPLDEDPSSFLV